MIVNNAQTVLYNGTPVQAVLCNGVKVWPNDGYRVYISNSGASANKIGVGLSAYMGDALIYSQAPVSGSSYSSDELPSGARVEIGLVTQSGYRASASSDTTPIIRYVRRDTGISSTTVYSSKISADKNIDIYDYGVNSFYVSGSSNARTYVSDALEDVYGGPLRAVYCSGDSSVVENRLLATFNNGHTSTNYYKYLAEKTYKDVFVSSNMLIDLTRNIVSSTANISANICLGIVSASSQLFMKPSSYPGESTYTSTSLNLSRSSAYYTPSATATAGKTLNYMSYEVRIKTNPYMYYTGGLTGQWYMTGIAP